MTGGREMMPTLLDRAQGGLEASDNPLDVALVGDGFLAVEKNGARHLTRDGRLAVNAEGELSLAADPGVRVLDAATDGPIRLGTLTPDQLRIDERGVVRNTADGDAPIGTLSLATADTVRPLGGGLLTATGPTRPAADVQVRGGFVEQSNVEATTELTRLIEAGRLLEANANMIRFQDSSLGRLIEASRVG